MYILRDEYRSDLGCSNGDESLEEFMERMTNNKEVASWPGRKTVWEVVNNNWEVVGHIEDSCGA